jgi:hypothetical protein
MESTEASERAVWCESADGNERADEGESIVAWSEPEPRARRERGASRQERAHRACRAGRLDNTTIREQAVTLEWTDYNERAGPMKLHRYR